MNCCLLAAPGAHLVAPKAPAGQVGTLLQHEGLHGLHLLNVLLTLYCLGGQAVFDLQGTATDKGKLHLSAMRGWTAHAATAILYCLASNPVLPS